MTNTPNFNLSIAEGTDTVNLLTQCYPNFETIDTVMKENKDAAITTATETKTGTNHSIVRANADAEVFRFTATSDYVAGDTFTVDAQAVTVTTPDGQSLQSGAFVINKSVMCCLVGTVLTVFVGGGSSDAQTLGGQLPSYYAKQSDMDVVENDVDTLNSNLTDFDWSKTSIPIGTNINTIIQMLMEKSFPKVLNLLTKSTSLWKTYLNNYTPSSNSVTYTNYTWKWSIRGSASGGEHKALVLLDDEIDITNLNTIVIIGSAYAEGTASCKIGLYRNRPTSFVEPFDVELFSGSATTASANISVNTDISNYTGKYYIGISFELYSTQIREISLTKCELS